MTTKTAGRATLTITAAAIAALLAGPGAALAHGEEAHSDSDALCEPYLGLKASFNSDAPDPALIEQQIADAEAAVSADLADDLDTMVAAAETVLASQGEDFSAFETPEFVAAQSALDGWAFETCALDATASVAGSDFAFGGLPEEIPAGETAILFVNTGEEAHEIAIMRRAEGVTTPWEELLELPEEEAMESVEFVAGAFAPVPESQTLLVVDLAPGDYLAVCFIAEGTVVTDDGFTEGTGAPHFAHGMMQEFTVTG